MKVGYARVSTPDQKLDRQVDLLEKQGCEKIFTDKASGARESRPGLDGMLSFVRAGDVVVVQKLDRIGRSTKNLIELSERFSSLGVDFVSVDEAIDTTTPQGRFFFAVTAAFAEFERDLISERTKDGLAAARRRGHVGGRPKANPDKISLARKMYASGDYSASEIARACGISRSTLYNYVDARGQVQKGRQDR